jgi:hypothetical protein
MFLILGFVVMLPYVRSAVEVSRMRESETVRPNSEIKDALGRIRCILLHWALWTACFVALRVSLVLTQRSQAPVQATVRPGVCVDGSRVRPARAVDGT